MARGILVHNGLANEVDMVAAKREMAADRIRRRVAENIALDAISEKMRARGLGVKATCSEELPG